MFASTRLPDPSAEVAELYPILYPALHVFISSKICAFGKALIRATELKEMRKVGARSLTPSCESHLFWTGRKVPATEVKTGVWCLYIVFPGITWNYIHNAHVHRMPCKQCQPRSPWQRPCYVPSIPSPILLKWYPKSLINTGKSPTCHPKFHHLLYIILAHFPNDIYRRKLPVAGRRKEGGVTRPRAGFGQFFLCMFFFSVSLVRSLVSGGVC